MTGPTVPVSGPEDGVRRSGHCAKGNHYDCSGHLGCYCECHTEPVVADSTAGEAEVERAAQAIRDSNGTPEALAWWRAHPQLIPAHVYARAALAARSGGAQDDGNARRLAWFTDDELTAELRRRALAGPDDTQQDGAR